MLKLFLPVPEHETINNKKSNSIEKQGNDLFFILENILNVQTYERIIIFSYYDIYY
jgi:hypothetical protein